MRAWVLGSNDGTGVLPFPEAPRKCYTAIPGTRSNFTVDPFGYPAAFTDDEFCEINYRIREIESLLDIELDGTVDGDTVNVVYSLSGVLTDSTVTDERVLADVRLQGQNPLWLSSVDVTITTTINGLPSTVTGTTTASLAWLVSESMELNPFVPYYYRTDGLWVPSMQFAIPIMGSTFLTRLGTLDAVPPGPDETTFTDTNGNWRGIPVTSSFTAATGLGVVSFELSLNPVLWWAYKRSDGSAPIWDENTGAQLLPNTTRGF